MLFAKNRSTIPMLRIGPEEVSDSNARQRGPGVVKVTPSTLHNMMISIQSIQLIALGAFMIKTSGNIYLWRTITS